MSYASDALIDAQRDTINRLKTENENLRRAAERDADVMEALVSYIDDSRVDGLCEENAKLRELVRDLYAVTWPETYLQLRQAYAKRMEELGIEVES